MKERTREEKKEYEEFKEYKEKAPGGVAAGVCRNCGAFSKVSNTLATGRFSIGEPRTLGQPCALPLRNPASPGSSSLNS